MNISKVGIIANPNIESLDFAVTGLSKIEQKTQVYYDPVSAVLLQREKTPVSHMSVDTVIVFGGDGSILYSVNELREQNPKVIGINMGRIGFLAETTPRNFQHAIECLIKGDYTIEERVKIQTENYEALNEFTLAPQHPTDLLDFKITTSEIEDITFSADGVIVATPTGSTGHSHSVGGPIISQKAPVLVISPINPAHRKQAPLIVPDTEKINITQTRQKRTCNIISDGRLEGEIADNQTITVQKSKRSARFIQIPRKQ